MMVSTGANSQLVYQSALAATSTLDVLSAETSLAAPVLSGGPAISGASGRWAKELRI
jgi:hypothetical protein